MTFARSIATGCWVACALLSSAAQAGTACDKQPVKAAHVQSFGRDMIVNGVPTSMSGMEFDGSPADVSDQFRDFWKQEGVPAKLQQGKSGRFLSALDDTCSYVLTIPAQPDGARTQGLLSVVRLSGETLRREIPDAAIPLPDGGRPVSDIESHDPGQAGRTWLVSLAGRAGDNAQRYRGKLTARGWTSATQTPSYLRSKAPPVTSNTVAMQRGIDHIDAVFSDRNGQTDAVINATRNR